MKQITRILLCLLCLLLTTTSIAQAAPSKRLEKLLASTQEDKEEIFAVADASMDYLRNFYKGEKENFCPPGTTDAEIDNATILISLPIVSEGISKHGKNVDAFVRAIEYRHNWIFYLASPRTNKILGYFEVGKNSDTGEYELGTVSSCFFTSEGRTERILAQKTKGNRAFELRNGLEGFFMSDEEELVQISGYMDGADIGVVVDTTQLYNANEAAAALQPVYADDFPMELREIGGVSDYLNFLYGRATPPPAEPNYLLPIGIGLILVSGVLFIILRKTRKASLPS